MVDRKGEHKACKITSNAFLTSINTGSSSIVILAFILANALALKSISVLYCLDQ